MAEIVKVLKALATTDVIPSKVFTLDKFYEVYTALPNGILIFKVQYLSAGNIPWVVIVNGDTWSTVVNPRLAKLFPCLTEILPAEIISADWFFEHRTKMSALLGRGLFIWQVLKLERPGQIECRIEGP